MSKWFCSASALATMLALAAGPAAAQDPAPVAPVYAAVDQNGVDYLSGRPQVELEVTRVGNPGAGELKWSFQGEVLRNDLYGQIVANTIYTDVSVGGKTVEFLGQVQNGQSISDITGANALSLLSGIYTFTAADGTVAHFSTAYTYGNLGSGLALATDLIRPDGEKLTYHYFIDPSPEDPTTGIWPDPYCNHANCAHLQSVESNLGYVMRLEWQGTTYATGADKLSRVIAYNLTSQYCAPTASSCSGLTSSQWSYKTFSSGPLTGGIGMITDSLGRTTTYTGGGPLGQITSPTGVVTSYHYIADPNSVFNGRVSSVTRGGETWNYAWSNTNGTLTVTDPLGHQRVILISSFGSIPPPRVQSVTDELGRTTAYTLDAGLNNRITKITYPDGSSESYQYDSRSNVTQVTKSAVPGSGLADMVTTAVYPASCANPKTCNKPTSVTVNGQETDYTYDPNSGNIATVTEPAGANGVRPITTYTYQQFYAAYLNASGVIANAPTPVWRLTRVSQCKTQASCLNTSDEIRTTYSYVVPAGTGNNLLPTSKTVAAGDGSLSATTSYAYNVNGDLKTVDGPRTDIDDTTRDRWNSEREHTGHIDIDPDGQDAGGQARAERFTYNADGKLWVDDLGTVAGQSDVDWQNFTVIHNVVNAYDGTTGLKTQTTVNSGSTIYSVANYSYDAAFRLQCTAQRMNPSVYYSLPSSACSLSTNGAYGYDRITKNSYDAVNRLTQITEGYGTVGARNVKTITYVPDSDNIQTVADAGGHLTTYTYDGFGRLVQTNYPDPVNIGQSSSSDYTTQTYDPTTGNVTQERRRSLNVVAYTYDNRNRMTAISSPAASYGYDNLDRVTSATQFGQALTTAYDALGRRTSQTGPLGTVSYQYDVSGNRTRMTWPDGYYVTYDYNHRNDLKHVDENGVTSGVSVLATFTYNGFDQRTVLTRGDGAVTTYGYDPVGRLSSLAVTGTSNNQTLTFAYDPASEIVNRTSNNAAYAWNGLYSVDRAYSVNGLNQLTASGGQTLTYGNSGNLKSDGVNTYSYDLDNRFIGTGAGAALSYDPENRLFQTTSSSGTVTKFLYDGDDLIGEYSSTNTLLQRYVHGPNVDEPLVWYQGSSTGNRSWLIADNQGSIVALANSSGTVTGINTYDEYGIPGAASPPQSQYAGVSSTSNQGRFQYTGQVWLWEAGLYDYKARDYSPTLGRFLQSDPVGYDAGMNLYAYVGINPINRVDPSGEFDAMSWLAHVVSHAKDLAASATTSATTMTTGAAVATSAASAQAVTLGEVVVVGAKDTLGKPMSTVFTKLGSLGLGELATAGSALEAGGFVGALMAPTPTTANDCYSGGTVSCAKPPSDKKYPDNPAKSPGKFRPIKGSPGKQNTDDESVWEKDRSSHGGEQWKRWPDRKSWENGNEPNSIWPDGTVRK